MRRLAPESMALSGVTLAGYYDAVICLNNSANLIKTDKHDMLSGNPSEEPQSAFQPGIKILGCSNSDELTSAVSKPLLNELPDKFFALFGCR